MLITPKTSRNLNEKGFASIVIALVLIIVLALVTIGFAQLARREQRDALNKQLASQAYFAAESGVNDVVKTLPAIAVANPPTNQCLDTSNPLFQLNPTVDQNRGISYSCVLVDMKPPNLLYDNVAAEEHRYVTFLTSPSPLTSIKISWGSADNQTAFRTSGGFTQAGTLPSQWNGAPPVLEVSLTPLGTGTLQRSSLLSNNFNVYLYPYQLGAGTVTFNTSSQGQIKGRCSGTGTYPCSLTINGVPGLVGQWYLLHIIDHYDPANINITGLAGLTPVQFIDAQAQIDSTGKSREVLRRIRVRVPIHPFYGLPKYSVESQNTCKRFTIDPTNPAPTSFDGLDPSCNLVN